MHVEVRPWTLAAGIMLLAACGAGTPPPEAPVEAPPAVEASPAAEADAPKEPEREKLLAHLRDHVQYPVTRSALLAACADTAEFSPQERKWVESKVPEGNYGSPEEVMAAIGM